MKEILLVDDHAMIREAIKLYLFGNKEFRVVDEAENGKEALEYLEKRSYDLVITDLNMPELSGMGLVNRIKTDFPDQSVIVLSMDYSSNTIKGLIAAGVKGYVVVSQKVCLGKKVIHGNNFSFQVIKSFDRI
ncbi:MAG: response regulator transcription factor [Cyclobacteriaceae bacterium]